MRDFLRADRLSFAYGGNLVLEDVSFSVPQGAYVGIVGPNGGGKTTLLRLLLGLEQPTSGTVTLLGLPPRHARRNGKVGYVPQRATQADLEFPATAEEVVRGGRTTVRGLLRRFTEEDERAIEHAVAMTGIEAYRGRRIGRLSGGERQKVFVARALAAEPSMLILDEPLTGIDQSSQEEFYAFLRSLNRSHGMTVLFVSHDVDVIAKEASSILCLNRTLVAHCAPQELERHPGMERLYGPSVARIRHAHHHHHDGHSHHHHA